MTMRDSIHAARINGPRQNARGTATLEFRFAPDDPTFAGHFPSHPLLPGVFQLEMSRLSAELLLSCPLELREITKAKFTRPILPDETVRVDLKLAEDGSKVKVQADFSVGGQRAGEVVLQLWRNA